MIITDEKLLRVVCEPVSPEEIEELRAKLEAELEHSAELGRPGIGLAAPQIGIPKRMAIIRIPTSDKGAYSIDLVNCRIKQGYDLSIFQGEGCLSFPAEMVGRTKRYQEIYVVDNMVEPFSFIAKGLPAVCIQHELDHLDGKLLPDMLLK